MTERTNAGSKSDGLDTADVDFGSSVPAHKTFRERLVDGFREDKKALAGGFIVIAFVLLAILAPLLSPYDPEQSFQMLQPPMTTSEFVDSDGQPGTAFHLLGTNSYGQDVLSRIIYGARISLLVAFATVAFAFTIGTTIGLVAGYYGGVIDNILMRYVDFQWALPALVLAVGIIAITGSLGARNVVIAIGIAFIDDFARLIRGEVLSLRKKEYVLSARAVGMSDRRIMFREILPNAVAPLIVQATLMIPLAILIEAALSFLGLGVRPTTPTWGLLISDGRDFITQAWWISLMPGFAILFVVLGFNMFGDGLRDTFDVTTEEER